MIGFFIIIMTKIKSFANKVTLVTGGSSGIGLATARLLAQQGAHVYLIASRADRLASALALVKGACSSPDQRCDAFAADVADNAQVEKAVAQVVESAGVPDLLINSAGVAQPGYVQEIKLDTFRWMMDVNFYGTLHVTKALLLAMIERRSGYIVNISSVAGFLGVFGYTAYGASKYAVRGFSEVLRAEMKPHGIGVSIVYPSDTDTPQLSYENQFKPVETKALAGNTTVMTAEAVASSILKGVARGRFVILPGLEGKLLYRLSQLLGDAVYPIMDMLIAQAQRANGK
jgi:3-dehydrosphinganine reductase